MLTDPLSGSNADRDLDLRLVNLITGLELLSIGTAFHDFNKDGSNIIGEESASREKSYTLDLLFGDIFYSRAVIYLLKFRDHKVFDSILEALKELHDSRLKLHLIIQKILESGSDPGAIEKNKRLLIDANRLLFISCMVGQELPGSVSSIKRERFAGIINIILEYKTYGELLKYVRSFSDNEASAAISGYLKKGMEDTLRHIRENLQNISDIKMRNALDFMLECLKKD
jgi:hypothetical protein